jgi:multicomponent Na+:H+ antiporter subunit G
MAQSVGIGLMLVGAVFGLVAAIGVLRMPDIFLRMHASTKSATLGIAMIMLGASLYFNNLAVTARSLAVVVFLFTTAPVAAHMVGRAAYFSRVPLWSKTLGDDLQGRYDLRTHELFHDFGPDWPEIPESQDQD